MKISNETLEILKNFAAINSNIVFKNGNKLKTISETKSLLAEAFIAEEIPLEFGIYNLGEFLSTLSLVSDGEIDFGEKSLVIKGNSSSIEYFYSSTDVLTYPKKDITMPPCELEFILTGDNLNKLKKAAGVFGHSTLIITAENGVITITAGDNKNATSNTYSLVIDENNDNKESYKFIISVAHMKLLPGDYTVKLSTKQISEFSNNDNKIKYWIALEQS
jgi:hypothetical protein